MEFSPTKVMSHVPTGILQSPYRSHPSEASPARNSNGYDSLLRSPASSLGLGHRQNYHHQHHYMENVEQKPQLDRQVDRLVGSPRVKASPKRQFSPYISCMFASSPASSPASPAPSSSPLMSSPASTSASSPYYPHHLLNSNTKRQLMWKENNPSSALYPPPSPATSHHSPAHPHHPRPPSLSPSKISLSHCKRRLDFNHNPVAENDLDLNLNVSYAAATHTIDELALTFSPDLSPSLTQPAQGDRESATFGRVPAVAVARRNERERNRVKLINMTFATLREHLPHGSNGSKGGKSRKMSKVETLRAAIEYIRQLHTLIKEKQQQQQSSKENDHPHDAFHKDKQNLNDALNTVLKVEAVDMEVDEGCLTTSSSSRLPLLSSSSLELASPQSSAGGAQSPVSDDGCFAYDLLSTEDEDLLEFASNWF